MKYEFLEHTADVKFRAYGENLNEAFENVAKAISEIFSKGTKIKSKKWKTINVQGEDKESLLYNFIDELVYLLDAENFVIAKAEVFIRGNNLKAKFYGDSTSGYSDLDHIKAATYSEMFVRKVKDGWEIQAVVDV